MITRCNGNGTNTTTAPLPRRRISRTTAAVVIPAFNGGEKLLSCLHSFLHQTAEATAPIIIVDNASSDGSVAEAQRRFCALEVIRNESNLGFGIACNQGINLALKQGAEFVLLANQDTIASDDLLEKLLTSARECSRAGVIGPKTLSFDPMPDGRPRLAYAGAWRCILPLRQRVPGINQADSGAVTAPLQVDYVWGHGMLLRAAALKKVGLFDPGFFMYYEDLDLCDRMKSAGWELWCDPRAVMWHDVRDGARALNSELWRWRHKVQSARYFHRKRFTPVTSELLTAATIILEALSLLRNRHVRAAGHLFWVWNCTLFNSTHKTFL